MNPSPAIFSVLAMDNTQIHHSRWVAEKVESVGCLLLYLPAYYPDLNPIKNGLSIFKSALRCNHDILTGGEDYFHVIDEFFSIVFTSNLIKKLFSGCVYGL